MKQKKAIASALLVYILLGVSMSGNAKEKNNKDGEKQTSATAETDLANSPNAKPLPMTFFGGMVLTKVTLQTKESLVPFANVTDENYEVCKIKLAGLLIFHVRDETSKLPTGAYVWDGQKWQTISK